MEEYEDLEYLDTSNYMDLEGENTIKYDPATFPAKDDPDYRFFKAYLTNKNGWEIQPPKKEVDLSLSKEQEMKDSQKIAKDLHQIGQKTEKTSFKPVGKYDPKTMPKKDSQDFKFFEKYISEKKEIKKPVCEIELIRTGVKEGKVTGNKMVKKACSEKMQNALNHADNGEMMKFFEQIKGELKKT